MEPIYAELEKFGRMQSGRDALVMRAVLEKVPQKDIARLTTLGHATISRIIARHRSALVLPLPDRPPFLQ